MSDQSIHWSETILPKRSWFDLKLSELWHYRDLLMLFVKRDIITTYHQTILGPLWFFIQPVLTTLMFTVVFGNFAGISTDGMPKMLFYLSGITIWNYFSESFNKTSTVFTRNASIFGKVYFPRLIVPLSVVLSGLFRFLIQFLLFIAVWFYYLFQTDSPVHPGIYIALTPLLLLMMAGFALGAGILISAMTTKYRDFTYLTGFAVTLLMYATPIIYPINSLPAKYKPYAFANPLSSIVETFRFAFLGTGAFDWYSLLYSFLFMLLLLTVGVFAFNRVEKNFMDTV